MQVKNLEEHVDPTVKYLQLDSGFRLTKKKYAYKIMIRYTCIKPLKAKLDRKERKRILKLT